MIFAALPAHADPFKLIIDSVIQHPAVASVVGLALLVNILVWVFKKPNARRRR
ncbi:hypothetical protein [Prosthecobacter sp.]|uniref:hypothetical protein n=1 Tax=Prosthecobacter sp. TaxID=1965333 RepID=UPI001E1395B8|nr:hypothetical protein [Prosthecobacter sp.]MCB1276166.1 hypothetical protein [Prosthecobacter sp.]